MKSYKQQTQNLAFIIVRQMFIGKYMYRVWLELSCNMNGYESAKLCYAASNKFQKT